MPGLARVVTPCIGPLYSPLRNISQNLARIQVDDLNLAHDKTCARAQAPACRRIGIVEGDWAV